ncbi:MAG TPA: hypothetical protein VIV11_00255 [Kofleriaceae bacterium]
MRRRCELVPVLVLAGCNTIFGLERTVLVDAEVVEEDADLFTVDRDRDGVPDDMDSCIASIADAELDVEGDGQPNKTDPCPFDYGTVDTDMDGVFDDCDPFPNLTGDRMRCVMTFASAPINRALWEVRDGEWHMVAGFLGIVTPGTVVAAVPFEAPIITTYDARISSGPSAVTLWVRTGDVASPTDVGCELRGNTTNTTLSVLGAPSAMTTVGQPIVQAIRLRATISPLAPAGMMNLRCSVAFTATSVVTQVGGAVALPAGRVGFTFEAATGAVYGLTVLERDDTPSL